MVILYPISLRKPTDLVKVCSLPRTEEDILADTNYEETETYFPYYLSRNVSRSNHARAYSFRLLREEDE